MKVVNSQTLSILYFDAESGFGEFGMRAQYVVTKGSPSPRQFASSET